MIGNYTALLGDFAKIKFDTKAAFGGYELQRQVKVTVSDGHTMSKRRFLSSDKYTALGNLEVHMVEPVHDPRGYNTEVIDETGDIKPELFISKLRTHGGLPKTALQLVTAEAESYIWDDSQITLLVALLSTYYVLKYRELKSDISLTEYNDGHISFSLQDQIAGGPYGHEWWNETELIISGWDQTTHDSPGDRDIMYVTGMTAKQLKVLHAHLKGRKKTSPLAFDLEIPRLLERVMFTGNTDPDQMETSRIRASDVLSTLHAYIDINRLYGAFEAALAIYQQVALTPVPDTAEGMAWLIRPRYVNLPRFRAHRGLYAVLMRDRPFGLSSSVTTTWKWWRDAGLTIAVQGALFNAASLWGRYFVEGGFYHDDADVHRLGSFEFATSPSAAHYAYAALVTGHDTYCPVPRNLGMGYARWLDGTEFTYRIDVADAELTGYNIRPGVDGTYLVVSVLPQPCSTLHVMGRMPHEGYFSCLSSEFKVEFKRLRNGWVLPNIAQAWGFGLASRWLGYDAEMSYEGQSRIANWASNDSSMAARPFHVQGPDIQTVRLNQVIPRQKTFALLPSMAADHNTWDVSYTVDDVYTLKSVSGMRIGTAGTFRIPDGKETTIIVPDVQSVAYTPVTLRVSTRANVQLAGFQVLRPDTSHHPPDPISSALAPDELANEDDPGAQPAGA